ncbi:MAG: glycosyl hydrolase, partial [Chitinophagaceae bacterium]
MKKFSTVLAMAMWATISFSQKVSKKLIDAKATKETKALYQNLAKLSENKILFGHQHATEYGHGWAGDADRSDVKSVTGSHPAVIGVDFSGLYGGSENMIEKTLSSLQKTIADTYDRGGVITAAWHFSNPVSKTNFNWNDSTAVPAVRSIIPGGSHNEKYKGILSTIARLANST